MCWLVQKPKGKTIPQAYIEKAQRSNKDGYGLSYFDGTTLQVFKTMDFAELQTKLATLTDFDVVLHLRAASIGKVTLDNAHPFSIPNGVLYHNGTMSNMKSIHCDTSTCADNSDTRNLANLITKCKYTHLSDILPLIHQIIGTTGNKLVFHENDGTITILNKNLGSEEDGIWYSSSYHKSYETTYSTQSWPRTYGTSQVKHKVFVYGTLKRGGANHSLLESSTFLGTATTTLTYAMIGKDMPFPYLLQLDSNGHNIEGELYEVTDTVLGRLDILEGVPSLYKHTFIGVKLANGAFHTATTYIKSHVTAADLARPFISSFDVPKPALPLLADEDVEDAKYTIATYNNFTPLSQTVLSRMSNDSLYSHLCYVSKLYYNLADASKIIDRNRPAKELREEIEFIYECIEEEMQNAISVIYPNLTNSNYAC